MTTSPPRPRRQATRGAAKLLLATVSAAGIVGGWAVISRAEAAATSVPMTLVSAPPAPVRGPLPAILVPPAAIAEVPGVAGRPAAPPLELPPIPELTAPLPGPAVAPEASDEDKRADETAAPKPLVPVPTSVPRTAAHAQSPSEPNQQPAASAPKPAAPAPKPPVPAAVPPVPAGPAPKPAAPPPPAPAPKPAAPPPAAPAPPPPAPVAAPKPAGRSRSSR
jgi:hypothetical protein